MPSPHTAQLRAWHESRKNDPAYRWAMDELIKQLYEFHHQHSTDAAPLPDMTATDASRLPRLQSASQNIPDGGLSDLAERLPLTSHKGKNPISARECPSSRAGLCVAGES